MLRRKKLAVFFLISALTLFLAGEFKRFYLSLEDRSVKAIELQKLAIHPIFNGSPIPPKNPTKIVLLGDSMTERLGNSDILARYLSVYYPNRKFLFLNYGYGATNILSVNKRLTQNTWHDNRVFQPILSIDFDVILIESFGNNPLSKYPLDLGLRVQDNALDKIVSEIHSTHPNSKIIFVATIAPNRENYAKNSENLSEKERIQWADERSAYIKNHIRYAQTHNIPVIDVYDQSTNFFGDGNLDYIDKADYIHPSPKGNYLIAEEIATFLYKNSVFTQ